MADLLKIFFLQVILQAFYLFLGFALILIPLEWAIWRWGG